MSTCLADSSSDGCYTSITMSKSSSSSSNASISTSPTESSATEGLEHVNIHLYAGISNMQKLINSQSERLQKGDSNQQYLIFTRVRAADLAKIDDVRSSLGKSTRMTYYTDTDQLIIKLMPSAKHEKAHLNLGKAFIIKVKEITINPNTVTGAPLILHFQKYFLRQPTPPEADIVFSAQDLSDFSASLW